MRVPAENAAIPPGFDVLVVSVSVVAGRWCARDRFAGWGVVPVGRSPRAGRTGGDGRALAAV